MLSEYLSEEVVVESSPEAADVQLTRRARSESHSHLISFCFYGGVAAAESATAVFDEQDSRPQGPEHQDHRVQRARH